MKKYNKIMGVFTETLTKLDTLVVGNETKAGVLDAKREVMITKVMDKADKLANKALELSAEVDAAKKAADKIKDFLS